MFTSEYWHPSITADVVYLKLDKNNSIPMPQILLVTRKNRPYINQLALPGGFMDRTDDSLKHTAVRELKEETGLDFNLNYLKLINEYSNRERDPRERVVSFAYLAIANEDKELIPVAQDDAAQVGWYDLKDLKSLTIAFDHRKIITDAIQKEMNLLISQEIYIRENIIPYNDEELKKTRNLIHCLTSIYIDLNF